MPLHLLIGGARSGKSSLAVEMAKRDRRAVVFIATGSAGDEEMAARIAHHRDQRPREWATLEERTDIATAIRSADPDAVVILDCLTLWVANVLDAGDDVIVGQAREASAIAAARQSPTIAVTNEVGSGIVPFDPDVRRYRDLLGHVNALFAGVADQAWLVVAGRVLELEHPRV